MLTAIIPLDLQRRPADLINKAKNLALEAHKHNIKLVFGHNDRHTRHDDRFTQSMSRYPNVSIRKITNFSSSINSSQLRNVAFEGVTTSHLILLDVDIYPDFELFLECQNEVSEGRQPFIILPCLYLTKLGSKRLSSSKLNKEKLKEKYFSFSRKEFLHLASPSSIVIMSRSDYLKAGCFNESFTGHGYEDFDFLIRLGLLYQLITKPKDFLEDIPYRSPLFAVGFRKSLGKLCVESLAKKRLAFHLYHNKDNDESYYKSRNENSKNFIKIHQDSIDESIKSDRTLLEYFIAHCISNEKTYQDYAIFFDNKPGHADRFDTFKRRIRFLLNI